MLEIIINSVDDFVNIIRQQGHQVYGRLDGTPFACLRPWLRSGPVGEARKILTVAGPRSNAASSGATLPGGSYGLRRRNPEINGAGTKTMNDQRLVRSGLAQSLRQNNQDEPDGVGCGRNLRRVRIWAAYTQSEPPTSNQWDLNERIVHKQRPMSDFRAKSAIFHAGGRIRQLP